MMISVKKIIPKRLKLFVSYMICKYKKIKLVDNIKCKYRELNCSNRVLPNFIIIGAQKSGTTSLYHYLCEHPQLIPSYKKEVHFFDGGINPNVDNYQKGETWYCSNFQKKHNVTSNQKAFEASPLYLFNPLVPQRIFKLLPNAKLIAILRNPTERAISHYFHVKRENNESLPILEALQSEEERLKPIIDNQDYKNNIYINHSYKSRGLYYEQIKRYLNHFPKSNILVLNSEKLFTHPSDTLQRIFKFVGIDTDFNVGNLMPRGTGTNKTKIAPAVYEYLNDYFRPHNQKLYKLIGEDFGW